MLTRLRVLLVVFFLALAIPSVVLIYQAYGQMQWEAFHQQRVLAEELASRIDERFRVMAEEEEARSFADYRFLVVSGDASANFLQRSPLSSFPPDGRFPGLLAYFQVDSAGAFSTPLVPEDSVDVGSLGISVEELDARLFLGRKVHALLSARNLVQRQTHGVVATEPLAPSGESVDSLVADELDLAVVVEEKQAAERLREDKLAFESVALERVALEDTQVSFDALKKSVEILESAPEPASAEPSSLGRVGDLNLDATYAVQARQAASFERSVVKSESRSKRKEQAVVPRSQEDGGSAVEAFSSVSVSTFDTEIDPFSFALLDERHFVLFRHVWRERVTCKVR